jgi:predicted nucleic acid-binding protein
VDRLFLDANVLFSAAYHPEAKVRKLWGLSKEEASLLSSPYVFEEARRNLAGQERIRELEKLVEATTLVRKSARRSDHPHLARVELPDKDWPVLLAAIASEATHLITGDRRHFGPYYGEKLGGVLISSPAAYLLVEESSIERTSDET